MSMIAHEHDITAARLRSKVYSLLADGFSQVDEKQFQSLKNECIPVWRNISELLEDGDMFNRYINWLEKEIHSLDYAELLEEYSRLFEPRNKLQVPPYETEYTLAESPQHALSQPAHLADIAGFYKAFGLSISVEKPDRVDHISTELEFMHVLAHKELLAIENDEKEHIEIVRDAQRKFVADHLGRWTGKFKNRLAQNDCDKFYIILADMLDLWIGLDKAYLFSGDK